MNTVHLIGRICNDLEVRTVGNDFKVLSFAVAYNERKRNGEDEASFFDVQAWNVQAETIAKYFRKGERIGIIGRLKQDRFQDQQGNKRSRVTIVLREFSFIESKSESSNKQEYSSNQSRSYDNYNQATNNQFDTSSGSSGMSFPEVNNNNSNFVNDSVSDDEVPF